MKKSFKHSSTNGVGMPQRYSIFANIQAFWRKIQAYRRLRRINDIAYQNAIQYLLLIADKLDKFHQESIGKGGYYEK